MRPILALAPIAALLLLTVPPSVSATDTTDLIDCTLAAQHDMRVGLANFIVQPLVGQLVYELGAPTANLVLCGLDFSCAIIFGGCQNIPVIIRTELIS